MPLPLGKAGDPGLLAGGEGGGGAGAYAHLLNQRVHIAWPYLKEAMVVAVRGCTQVECSCGCAYPGFDSRLEHFFAPDRCSKAPGFNPWKPIKLSPGFQNFAFFKFCQLLCRYVAVSDPREKITGRGVRTPHG